MASDDYHRALDAATKEYETLAAERRRIDQRLTELSHSIGTLTRLCGYTPTVTWGLTDACRTVLRTSTFPMTPAEVRDRLTGIGFDLATYSNPLAAIHTTLKRLTEADELKQTVLAGKIRYIWFQAPKADMLARIQARVSNDIEAQQKAATRRKKR